MAQCDCEFLFTMGKPELSFPWHAGQSDE